MHSWWARMGPMMETHVLIVYAATTDVSVPGAML